MKHIFITGDIGIGKSTLIGKLLSLYPDKKPHGFYTKKKPVQPDGGCCVYIHPAQEAKRHYNKANCIAACAVGHVQIYGYVLDTAGAALLSGIPPMSLVVMDELGFFESEAPAFCSKVLNILDSDCSVIGVVRDAATPFLDAVRTRPDVAIYRMTMENRDTLFDRIRSDILNGNGNGSGS
ncbi:MAG: nucleoside-triphosphatase [Saccharofermentanales bacterium]